MGQRRQITSQVRKEGSRKRTSSGSLTGSRRDPPAWPLGVLISTTDNLCIGPQVRYNLVVFGLNELGPDRTDMFQDAQSKFLRVVVSPHPQVRVASLDNSRTGSVQGWNARELSKELKEKCDMLNRLPSLP